MPGGPSVLPLSLLAWLTTSTLSLGASPPPESWASLKERFVRPPPGSGTVTLWWLNGPLTRDAIREQLLAMRDQCGFGGVAPLTLYRMKPATEPPYLSEEYFRLYGHILDTAKELGMTVVFYDDCDFPSGTAGSRMAEEHPDDLMKYLARGRTVAEGPGVVELRVPDGSVMSVVARDLRAGKRRVVTGEVRWATARAAFSGGSVGVRQAEGERAAFDSVTVTTPDGATVYQESFDRPLHGWSGEGDYRVANGSLLAQSCMPVWVRGVALPEDFTVEARVRILRQAAGIAIGCHDAEHHYFWQLHAGRRAIRPHVRSGDYRVLKETPFPLETDRWYRVRLVVRGSRVETWIDGRLAATHRVEDARRVLRWEAPAGRWDVQAFVCATGPQRRFVDCLEPASVEKFVGLTYDRFHERFAPHFGTTIRMSFFDDLAVYHVPDSAAWTPAFDDRFRARFGRDPDRLYPALWEDIGPDTAAARVHLLGLRNELFAAGYPRVTEAWCAEQGLVSSGHPACSYRANPLQAAGDGILFYKHQGYPLTDYIHYYHHGIDGFKIPASAAHTFDKPILVCEIYGNFHQPLPNDARMLYRAGMEVYARGVNFLLPHGTWWDPERMRIVPEISWRNPAMSSELPRYNRWAARCETLLRGGRHVADIGMVYPIADMSARYNFTDFPSTHGKDPLPGTDYYEIMRLLTGEIRRDFTLLHPEVIDERCRVDGQELVLDNERNRERYRLVVLPACRTIHLSNLRKIKAYHDRGGRVLATTCLPERSAEFGEDAEVQRIAREMFGPGGSGVFLATPDETSLAKVLDSIPTVWDVTIANVTEIPRRERSVHTYGGRVRNDPDAYEGGGRQFAYIHRELAGGHVYFFANSSALPVRADVQVRGDRSLASWDPHTGAIRPIAREIAVERGEPVTRLSLNVPPVRSVFLVSPRDEE